MTHNIAKTLARFAVPIDEVEPHPWNTYRDHDLGAIGESLTRFGQLDVLVAQAVEGGKPRIVAGRGRWLAAKQLGWDKVAVAVHELTEADAEAFIAADNRTAALGSNNTDELAKLMAHLADQDNLVATGYDGDDVDAIIADLERAAEPDDGPPAGADDEGIAVESQFAVAVLCSSEPHQREIFERLSAEGYACKVLTV